jgi:hypothetical protein
VKTFLNKYFLTDGVDFELIDKSIKEISKIINPVILSAHLEKGLIKIELNNYIKDIEGYALIKPKSEFIKKFEDINFPGTLYKYDDEFGLQAVNDFSTLSIDDYIVGKEINYLSIPLVEDHNEDDFRSGMKFTNDDIDEVINKMDREFNWISVIVPNDYQNYLSDEIIKSESPIFEKLGSEQLEEIGHSEFCMTKAFVKKITLFEGQKNNLYLPFDTKDSDNFLYHWRTPDKRKELFMRSVLIKDFRFNISISASVFEINTIVLNINSRKFIPDISRNNLDTKAKDLINYMVGKAIHLGAMNLMKLENDEKVTLQSFVNNFYEEKTEFEI